MLWLLGGAGAIVAVVAVGLIVLQMAIERGALTTRIDAALERALGRAVTLGPISIRPSWRLRVSVAGAAIANLPDGSQPAMARIGRLDLTLAVLPLLSGRVEVGQVTIAGAEILLERDAQGRPNWVLGEAATESGESRLVVAELRIEESRITLDERRLDITRLVLRRDDGATAIEGRVVLMGEAIAIAAEIGPWAATPPPPLRAALTGDGWRLALQGSLPRSATEADWDITLAAQADAPARLAAWAGVNAPAIGLLGAVEATARLGPGPDGIAVTEIVLRGAGIDLASVVPGLRIDTVELRAATPDAAMALAARGSRAGARVALAGTLPPFGRVVAAEPDEALPVEATITSGEASLSLRGAVTKAELPHSLVFDASLATPDLARLSPLAGVALPAIGPVTASARMGWARPAILRLDGFSIASRVLDGQGDLELALGGRLSVSGRIAARRLDLDALGTAPGAARDTARVIPNAALPAETLRGFDATVALSADRFSAGGLALRAVTTRVALAGGHLVLQPFSAGLPGGTITGRLALDASGRVPSVALSLRSSGNGIDLTVLERSLGLRTPLTGPAEIALDLQGRGATLRDLAASLHGEAGLAMVEGRLSWARLLQVGPNLAQILLPRGAPAEEAAIRCVALRLSADAGLVQSQAMLVEGPFGRIEGRIAINLHNETLAARLLPDIRVLGGVTVRTPISIGGTLAAPSFGMEPGAALAQVMADTVANRLWRSSTAELLRGASGDCAAQLRLARLGRDGRAPILPAAYVVPLVPRELQGAAQDVARGAMGATEDVLRGIGGVLGGGAGLLGGRRR
ncbi:AsmA family protein [Humitalea sp. 24SJ18S-53]|uniref:AsmA family protein n=1 Tax=Humitalea sp. 24SJ18S-53 TaxID=3422307 RepID=UPI003D669D07